MSKPLLPSTLRLWKPCSGNSGDCHVWKLATDPSPHSADGSPVADISPGGISAAGLWKAPLDGPLTLVPRERWQLLALRSHFIICPCLSLLSTDYCRSQCCHTLRRCSLAVRTLCLRKEEWDHDPPAANSYLDAKKTIPKSQYNLSLIHIWRCRRRLRCRSRWSPYH